MKKRIISLLLAAIMVVSLLPVTALAVPEEVPEGEGYLVTFQCDEHAKVAVYPSQDYEQTPVAATSALSVDGDTGIPTKSGDGQVNFRVDAEDGYMLTSVAVTSGSYKNLKGPSDTKQENTYRITKIESDLTVTVSTSAIPTGVPFFVAANSAAGLDGYVIIDFTKSGSSYTGNLYLPGKANTELLKLYWPAGTEIRIGDTAYENGSAPIPANGESLTYTVMAGGRSATYAVKTMKGSADVDGMFLNIDESLGTIAAMNGDRDHATSCYGVVSFDGDNYDMSMKGRGNWTWGVTGTSSNPSKKPYNITIYKEEDPDKGIERFDKKNSVSFIKGVKAKKWSILANYADGSLLRNKIGYDLACELGIGLESEYIDVWINGKYHGNYLITPKSDYNAPDGGYALELDNNLDAEDPYFALNGLLPAKSSENVITVKNVGDDAVDAGLTTEDIRDWMQTMLDAVMDTKSDDYLKYVDIDSWAKLYLLQEFYKNHDIICGSILMHRDGLTDQDKLKAGPVWDLDNALGRVFVNDHSGISTQMQRSANGWYIDSINGYTSFLQYLGLHENFMQRVYEIYNEYRNAFDGVTANLDSQAAQISDSANMNYSVWNVNQSEYNATKVSSTSTLGTGSYAYTEKKTNTYQDYVDNLRSYVVNRLAFLSDNLAMTAPEAGSITGGTSVDVLKSLSLTADCTADSYQWQSSADGETWTNISGATAKTYSTTALYPMNGLQIRCVAQNVGSIINTTRVAKAAPAASTVLAPVTLTVTLEGHEHNYAEVVTEPTCTEKGYTTHTCACGDSFVDTYTDAKGHDFVDGQCTRCPEKDPEYIPECVTEKTVSLASGKFIFTLGGNRIGEFTFAQSGSGWTIKGEDGKYLSFANNAFTYSDSAFVWTYSNGAFTTSVTSTTSSNPWGGYGGWGWGGNTTTTTTYYLTYSNGSFRTSTSSSGSNAGFITLIENMTHSFGDWTPAANEKHSRACTVCGEVEYEACDYGADHLCKVCKRVDPSLVYVTATFVTGSGASTAPASQRVISGEGLIEKPADPSKLGYLFDDWFAQGAETAFDFTVPLSTNVTLMAKWSECTEHTYGEDDNCTKCGLHDPSKVPQCISKKNVSLANGTFIFTLGGNELGEYTFAQSGNGWTIRGDDGRYLSFSNNAFAYSSSPFVWTYSNNAFTTSVTSSSSNPWGGYGGFGGWDNWGNTTTTYYLTYANGRFNASTNSNGSNAGFIQVIENMKHSYVDIVTAPTCTEQGYTTHTCACGDTYVDSYTDPKGHTYVDVVTKPTCTEKGYTTHTCSCGNVVVDTYVDELGHDYVDGACTRCKERDPAYVPECIVEKNVSLANGTFIFTLGGNRAGEFTFAQSGNGWTIRGDDGRYLSFSNNAFAYSSSPFVWTYSNNAFTTSVTSSGSSNPWGGYGGYGGWGGYGWGGNTNTTTTYYLVYSGNRFSTSTSSNGSNAGFITVIENLKHSFGAWTAKNGVHSRTCSVCGKVETGNCDYDDWTTENGVHSRTCSVCQITDSGKCSYTKWMTENGVHSRICTVCHAEETGECTYGDWTPDENGQHSKTCSVCGDKVYENCVFGADHHCDTCGQIDPNLVYVTATFVTGSGASAAPASQTVISGEGKITKPDDPTRAEYIFGGWFVGGDAFDFTAALTSNVTITAKWMECTEHEYKDGKCIKCGADEPKPEPECVSEKTVSLANGTFIFTLGGNRAGEFAFARSGSGWTIRGEDGRYLSFSNNAFTYSSSPFVWTYSNNAFTTSVTSSGSSNPWGGFGGWGNWGNWGNTTTTYYLTYANGRFNASTNSNGSNAGFFTKVTSDMHTYGKWTDNKNGTHSRVCTNCGHVEIDDCEYASNHICEKCGAYDPAAIRIEVNVSVTQQQSSSNPWGYGGWGGYGGYGGWGNWGSTTTTTYTATITVRATGTTVAKVEYSTNNGARWTTGSTMTSNSQIGAFLIRVTDGNGTIHNYQYNGTTVIAQ